MKHFRVPHGSEEWFLCRRGLPTASCFDRIITPGGKHSEQSAGYAHLLLAEVILNENLDKFPQSYWMERGALIEADAAALYEFETGFRLAPGGFMTDDDLRWGASPDRLILDADGTIIGGLEIKCPAPWTHVENLLKKSIDKKYLPQVQGQIFIGGFQFVDWFSYHPEMPPSLIRTHRDDDYIARLKEALLRFDGLMKQKLSQLVELRVFDAAPEKVMPDLFDPIAAMLDGEAIDTVISAG